MTTSLFLQMLTSTMEAAGKRRRERTRRREAGVRAKAAAVTRATRVEAAGAVAAVAVVAAAGVTAKEVAAVKMRLTTCARTRRKSLVVRATQAAKVTHREIGLLYGVRTQIMLKYSVTCIWTVMCLSLYLNVHDN